LKPWFHINVISVTGVLQPRLQVTTLGAVEWVLLAYRLPREPSTPRIAVWRKLRRLGAVQLVDGLVLLPATARTQEQLDWLADEVLEAGGDAWTWLARSGSSEQDRVLAAQLRAAAVEDYRGLLAEMDRLGADPVSRRTVERLRRELHRIEARDHAGPPERERARRALERLSQRLAADPEGARR
jgi:hypothetical protein